MDLHTPDLYPKKEHREIFDEVGPMARELKRGGVTMLTPYGYRGKLINREVNELLKQYTQLRLE